MEKEVLEVVLKRLSRESAVASIIDMKAEPAVPQGENYTSTILRVKLKVVLGNGRLANKSLITKRIFTEGNSGEWFKEINLMKTESQIYSVIHKEMTYLMEEFEDTDETLWCKFILYEPRLSCIVLEDLKPMGYSMVPRQKGLDLDHALLALTGLGRYHGMAKVLEERGIISKDGYLNNTFFSDLRLIKSFLYGGLINTSKIMLQSWGPKWEETAKKLAISFDAFYEKYKDLSQIEESEFQVLNHGDCWSNNMMFKYDFQNRPITVKFLDYQFPYYSSPCGDLTNIIYISVRPELRRSNYELFFKTYHNSLTRTLDKFGFRGTKPTLQDITTKMKRLEFFGLITFATAYPSLVGSKNGAFDMAKILETEGKEGFDQDALKSPEMIEKMGPDIIDFVEKHLKNLSLC